MSNPCTTTPTGCPIQLDSECVFYRKNGASASLLTCLDITAGTDLQTILEAIDEKLCTVQTYSFGSYNLNCMGTKYTITNIAQFIEATCEELCVIDNTLNTLLGPSIARIQALENQITALTNPSLAACNLIGLSSADSLKTAVTKLVSHYCNNYGAGGQDNSPNIVATNNQLISWALSGTKNHNISATLRISPDAGNILQTLSNGLYATAPAASLQSLIYNAGTGALQISGGNTVNLAPNTDNQTLSFDPSLKRLSIERGNSVDLSSLVSIPAETPLSRTNTNTIDITLGGTANHQISANVRIDPAPSNILTQSASGLKAEVANIPDEKVKTNVADASSGYLADKILPLVTSEITLTKTIAAGDTGVELAATFVDAGFAAKMAALMGNPGVVAALCARVDQCLPTASFFNSMQVQSSLLYPAYNSYFGIESITFDGSEQLTSPVPGGAEAYLTTVPGTYNIIVTVNTAGDNFTAAAPPGWTREIKITDKFNGTNTAPTVVSNGVYTYNLGNVTINTFSIKLIYTPKAP